MVDEMGDFFGVEEAQQEPEAQAESQAVEPEANPPGETPAPKEEGKGEEDSGEQDLDAINQDQLDHKDRGLLKAAKSERKKRQAMESKLQELEAIKLELAEVKGRVPERKQAAEDEGPSMYDDPDAWYEHRRAKERTEEEARYSRSMDYKINLALSRNNMRSQFEDYDEAEKVFDEMIGPGGNNRPDLAQQLVNSSEPAKFIYDTVKAQELNETYGGSSALSARIAELEAKLAAAEGVAPPPTQQPANIPKSQAGVRNVGNATAEAGDADPFDLDKMVGNDW